MKGLARERRSLAFASVTLAPFLVLTISEPAWAYLGPGAGLGMVGTLVAVVVAIVMAIVGVVLYPLRLLRKWRRERNAGREQAP